MSDRQWRPPAWAYRPFTPLIRQILRSPLRRLLSNRAMLLSYVGARTGRTYTFPIGWFSWGDGSVLAFSSTGWPAKVRNVPRVLLHGRWRDAAPTVFTGVDEVAEVLAEFVARKGPRTARQLLLGLPRDRAPTREELLAAATKTDIIEFRLAP